VLETLPLFVLGATAGFAGAPLGIGAAPFIAPLLVFGYHLPMGQALGTALAIGFLTGASGAAAFFHYYRIDLRPIQPLAGAGIVGTLLGSQFVLPGLSARFPFLLGLLLIGSLAYVLLRGGWTRLSSIAQRHAGRLPDAQPAVESSRVWRVKAIVTALLAGGVSRALGVGAGLVFVPFLTAELRLALPLALATAQAADVPVTFAGSLSFLLQGHLNAALVAYAGAGGMIGAQLGVWLLARCPPFVWELAYGVTCLGLGASLLALARPVSRALPPWPTYPAGQRGLALTSLKLPAWLGLLILTTTGAVVLLSIHLIRTVWRQRDL